MKIIDLYNTSGQLVKLIDNISPLRAKWAHNDEEGAQVVDLEELDAYIMLQIGNSVLSESVASASKNAIINKIRLFLDANTYALDGLYASINFEYNPIENYDKIEEQQHSEKITTADHQTITEIGERQQHNENGAQSITNTTSGSTSPFDAADYAKAANKNANSQSIAAYNDTITNDGATDTTTQKGYIDNSEGGYNLRTHGNVGVTTTAAMIAEHRRVVMFNFYDEIVKLFELYLTSMVYEF